MCDWHMSYLISCSHVVDRCYMSIIVHTSTDLKHEAWNPADIPKEHKLRLMLISSDKHSWTFGLGPAYQEFTQPGYQSKDSQHTTTD